MREFVALTGNPGFLMLESVSERGMNRNVIPSFATSYAKRPSRARYEDS